MLKYLNIKGQRYLNMQEVNKSTLKVWKKIKQV